MPLVTTNEMLKKAQDGHYAVGAFNVENMEMVMAVIKAAEEMKAPVIMQTTPSTIRYAGLDYYLAMVRTAAERADVPVAMHLDHGNSFELAMQALRKGYTSIMIDGSHESFEENIALTRRVVDACAPSAISVEAELGKVGGKEDDLEAADDSPFTDPKQAQEFAERTQVNSLAVAIGTAHGFYKGVPKLDFDRLSAIRELVSIPLILHGASGVPDDAVRESITRGICKVNFATELRAAFSDGVKAYLAALEKRRPGMMFTDLTMNDTEGKPRRLSEWCGKGNYVLVDFWASWCGPCRQEMPNVVANYKKYHAKGFEVVGVSFDNNAEAWKNAIKQIGMEWPNISDLKAWKSAAASIYGISAIPANILLDGEGKIVATDLRGNALGAKLKEVYGF